MIDLSRRNVLFTIAALAIVRATSLMPVRAVEMFAPSAGFETTLVSYFLYGMETGFMKLREVTADAYFACETGRDVFRKKCVIRLA